MVLIFDEPWIPTKDLFLVSCVTVRIFVEPWIPTKDLLLAKIIPRRTCDRPRKKPTQIAIFKIRPPMVENVDIIISLFLFPCKCVC